MLPGPHVASLQLPAQPTPTLALTPPTPPNCRCHGARPASILLAPPFLMPAQSLAHSRCSVNTYWKKSHVSRRQILTPPKGEFSAFTGSEFPIVGGIQAASGWRFAGAGRSNPCLALREGLRPGRRPTGGDCRAGCPGKGGWLSLFTNGDQMWARKHPPCGSRGVLLTRARGSALPKEIPWPHSALAKGEPFSTNLSFL